MATYILTKTQKNVIVDALKVYYVEALEDHGVGPDELEVLIKYIENPYSGSWMGKKNIR